MSDDQKKQLEQQLWNIANKFVDMEPPFIGGAELQIRRIDTFINEIGE